MLELIEYIETPGGVMICRCYGSGGALELPAQIDGLPVTGVADHCFAEEPSYKLRTVPKQVAVPASYDRRGSWVPRTQAADRALAEDCGQAGDHALKGGPDTVRNRENEQSGGIGARPLCASILEEIWLPGTLQEIGAYAFYGCHELKRLHIPAGVNRMGGGIFVACNHLEQIWFETTGGSGPEIPVCMQDVICELSYGVEAVFADGAGGIQARLYFPGYYEESMENTPARIIEIKYRGTGYKYRQCFSHGTLDMARYDSIFYEASVQEFPMEVTLLAFDRLQYPFRLSEPDRQKYLKYLRLEAADTREFILAGNRIDLLLLLCRLGYFEQDGAGKEGVGLQTGGAADTEYRLSTDDGADHLLDEFLDDAAKRGQAEAVSILMDWKRRQTGVSQIAQKRKRKYSL